VRPPVEVHLFRKQATGARMPLAAASRRTASAARWQWNRLTSETPEDFLTESNCQAKACTDTHTILTTCTHAHNYAHNQQLHLQISDRRHVRKHTHTDT